jgi:hypothetical protein
MDEPEDSLETAKIRPRFAASAEALVAVLIKHVTRPNKIKYGEDIGNSKVEPKMLQQNAALLLDLAGLHPNMSFSSKTMKQATMVVEQHYHDKWNLSPEEALDFSDKIEKRIRCMCSHFSTAKRRKSPPTWVGSIALSFRSGPATPGGEGDRASSSTASGPLTTTAAAGGVEGDDEDEEDDETQYYESDQQEGKAEVEKAKGDRGGEEADYFVGWNAEMEKMWRCRTDDPSGTKEFASKVEIPTGASPTDACIAVFSDGSRNTVACMTAGQWKAREAAKVAAATAHKHTQAPLLEKGDFIVKTKQDRATLLYIAKASKPSQQLCQVRLDIFDSQAQGLKVMEQIVDRLIADPHTEPYKVRDEILKSMGWPSCKKRRTAAKGEAVAIEKGEAGAEAENIEEGDDEDEEGDENEDESEAKAIVLKRPAASTKKRAASVAKAEVVTIEESDDEDEEGEKNEDESEAQAIVLKRPAASTKKAAASAAEAEAPSTPPSRRAKEDICRRWAKEDICNDRLDYFMQMSCNDRLDYFMP